MSSTYSLLLWALCLSLMLGCTKSQDVKLPDGEQDSIFPISTFRGTQGELTTSLQIKQLSQGDRRKASGEVAPVKVEQILVSGVPQAMIENLYIPAVPSSTYKVQFDINPHHIILSKLVDRIELLTEIEKQVAKKTANGLLKVPVFHYKIEDHGQLTKVTDSYGQATSTLRLKSTAWSEATHIRLSFLARDRIPLDSESANFQERNEIFLKDRINETVLTSQQLLDELKIPTAFPEPTLFYTLLSGNKDLLLYEVSSIDQLTPTQKDWLENNLSGGNFIRCPKSVLDHLPLEKQKKCVLIARYKAEVSHKVAELTISEFDGTPSTKISYRDAPVAHSTNLVHIVPHQLLTQIEPSPFLDPKRTFPSVMLRGEFLFRRTLNDGANGFKFSFPGSQGRLEIVKFVPEEKRVVVKRVDPIVKPGGQTEVDSEELLSIPAKYYRLKTVDEQGNPLLQPIKVEAQYDEAETLIELEWEKNDIPNVASPLDYHGVGQCFAGLGGNRITDLKQDLQEGVLNFSIEGAYTVTESACASQYLTSDYFFHENEQRTFTFKERLSFRRYNKQNDTNSISQLPFYAQKQLNFGVFTTSKLVPNDHGNIGRDGSEVHLPVLFDFKNAKTITYTLAGLPASGSLRQSLINSTEKVIANWNHALREAFKGSQLATSRDLIRLEVEGRDVDQVHLGDLDRNFIYWLEKNVAAGPIGIGGPSPNPRSGVIEASDIIIYGGNLRSSLESVKKMAAAKAFYEQVMQVIPANDGKNSEKILTQNQIIKQGATSVGTNELGERAPMEWNLGGLQDLTRLQPARDSLLHLRSAQLQVPTMKLSSEDLKKLVLPAEAKALAQITQELTQRQAHQNIKKAEGIINKRLREFLDGKLTEEQRYTLEVQALQAEFVEQVALSIGSGHQVVEMMDGAIVSGERDLKDVDLEQFLIEKYEAVLVHEMGHALGLTHNFSGSYDSENFLFASEDAETTSRPSSSVMDYLPMDIWEDSAPGPYDVHAIRAAYTGRIEVRSDIQNMAQKIANGDSILNIGPQMQLVLSQGRFMYIEDYKKVLGLDSWLNFDARHVNAIPLKPYKYCPDVEVNRFPTCNRFDHGGSATAIVQNMIKDYQAFYLLTNFPDQRLRFNWWESGNYIGRLFSTFQGIRHFMDETIFRLIQGDVGEETIEHARAAFAGMQFLHSVIRTPEANMQNSPLDRFELVGLQDGRQVVIEKRQTLDLLQPGGLGRMLLRGTELDKAVALIMLTVRQIGVQDYDQQNIRMSYPDFERIFFGQNITSLTELPTVGLLAEVISNNVTPMAMTALGPLDLGGSPNHSVNITELIRAIGVQSAILNLDVNTLEESDNFAALFRFGNTLDQALPEGLTGLTKLGASLSSPSVLKYWAFDGAEVSQQITDKAASLRHLIDHQKEVSSQLGQLLKLRLGLEGEENVNEQELITKLNQFLNEAPTAIGPKDLETISGYMQNQIDLAGQIIELAKERSEDEVAAILENLRQQNTYYSKNFPVIALAQLALLQTEVPNLSAVLGQMIVSPRLNIEYGLIYSNVELLNRLFYMIRPEYRN